MPPCETPSGKCGPRRVTSLRNLPLASVHPTYPTPGVAADCVHCCAKQRGQKSSGTTPEWLIHRLEAEYPRSKIEEKGIQRHVGPDRERGPKKKSSQAVTCRIYISTRFPSLGGWRALRVLYQSRLYLQMRSAAPNVPPLMIAASLMRLG